MRGVQPIMSVVSAESSNADDESLLEGTSSAAGAPLWAFVLGGFLPVPVVYVTFVRLQSAWGAALALEAAFVLVPAAICAVWPETRKRVAAAARQAMGGSGGQQLSLRAQLLAAVALGGATLVGAALAILLFEHFFASEWSHATRQVRREALIYGFSRSDEQGVALFGAWFCAVNPLLEELFWRIFLAHGFDHRAASHFLPANAAPRAIQKWTRGTRGTAALWVATSAFYASYHANVVFVFLPLPAAAAAVAGLVGYGVLLQLLVSRVGLVGAVGAHVGADAAVILGLTDAIWEYLRR
uniref:CAAX prenyl protease 2/Lysostaphin resistance protein A-like domain-containing protein n=1 Tax=Emiliania huxleyi TaxID=2903 RepID=A0A7S3SJ44_EMIHU|mmetsp:Transcript_8354/g.24631  ORF Transcript_8354/g.24631 Transcript_8354/m.24631 type:complete len:298 (+) Transcript_8354:96-989(+)